MKKKSKMRGGQIKFLFGIKKKRLEDGKNLSRNYSQGERVHSVEGIGPDGWNSKWLNFNSRVQGRTR